MGKDNLTTTAFETSSTMSDRTSRSSSPQPSADIRTLRIAFDSWTWRHGTITDADTQMPLYKLEYHLRSPQIIMRAATVPTGSNDKPPSQTELGSVKLHNMTTRIDLKLRGGDLSVHSKGWFKNGYTFVSRTTGSTYTWKSKGKCGYFDLLCLDEAGTQVARIMLYMMSGKSKAGKVQLTEESMRAGEKDMPALVDEFVLTGLAVLQARLNAYSASLGQTAVVSAVSAS